MGSIAALALETALRGGRRALAFRGAQAALVAVFGRVAAHRGEILCTAWERRHLAAPRNRLACACIYAWAGLAFFLCDRIEAAADGDDADADSDDSDDAASDGDDAEAGGGGPGTLAGLMGDLFEGTEFRVASKGAKSS